MSDSTLSELDKFTRHEAELLNEVLGPEAPACNVDVPASSIAFIKSFSRAYQTAKSTRTGQFRLVLN